MGFLTWLFGKKETVPPADRPGNQAPMPAGPGRPAAGPSPGQEGPPPEAENLRRWRESGQAWAWVQAHRGHWEHPDWLALLDELKRSAFWPMRPEAVGLVLEELKREWLRRN